MTQNQYDTAGQMNILERQSGEPRHTEDELRLEADRWRTMLQNSPDFIAMVSGDLIIEFLNRAVPGLDVQQMIGQNLLELIAPEHHELVRQNNDKEGRHGSQ